MRCNFPGAKGVLAVLLEDDPTPLPPQGSASEEGSDEDLDSARDVFTDATIGHELDQGSPASYIKLWSRFERARNRDRIKVANNTYLTRSGRDYENSSIGLRLHNTDVIRFFPDNSLQVNTGGWSTRTTLDRINGWLPDGWSVYTRKGDWFWYNSNQPESSMEHRGGLGRLLQPFSNGDVIDGTGKLRPLLPAKAMPAKREYVARGRRPLRNYFNPDPPA